MVWTSDQTSALIGGQQQQMMQQHQLAQSIGAGLHMPMPSGGVAGVHSLSNRMASGALSAAAAPINLASKAAGFAGLGLMGAGLTGFAGGKLGLGVTGRGLMASFGGLGGGAMGALGGLPMFGGLAMAGYGANQAISGYRETAQIGNMMAQNFSFANPQSFSGQGFAPKQVGEIARTMRSVATSSRSGMEDIMGTMQSMSDMGMLQTVRSAQDFEKKFKGMMESVKKISHTFNTSMKEAAELLGSMRSSGLYSAEDVMGGTLQRHTLGTHGLSGQQVTGLERAGAGMAARLGAKRGTGARLTTGLAATVGTAAQMGVLSSADLLEATGMEGADAYAALGQTLGGAAMQFTQGGAGRASMIYAAEKKGGRFTGQIDQGRMDDILSGRVGMDDILAEAGNRTRGEKAAASFAAVSPELSGNFAQGGGNQAMMSVVQDIAKKMGPGADEGDMITLVMDKIAGVDRQTASIMVKIASEWGDIRRQQGQEARQLMDARTREYERDYYRSWRGVKSRMGKGWKENVTDPIKGWGGDVGTSMEAGLQSAANTIYGRYESATLGEGDMFKARMGMAFGDGGGGANLSSLVGETLDFDGFSIGTRQRLRALAPKTSGDPSHYGPGGTVASGIKITKDNLAEIQSIVARESGMGAGVGNLDGISQSRIDSSGIAISNILHKYGIDAESKNAAANVHARLATSKNRSSSEEDLWKLLQEGEGPRLETLTALARGGGIDKFGAKGTFKANAFDELYSDKLDGRMSDLFNQGGMARAERWTMNAGGGILGGLAGAAMAPLSAIGIGLGVGALGGGALTSGWGGMQASRRGSFRSLSGRQESLIEGMLTDSPKQREEFIKMMMGDITSGGDRASGGDLLGELGAWAQGNDKAGKFSGLGEAGSDLAGAIHQAATEMYETDQGTSGRGASIRGNLGAIRGLLGDTAVTKISAALSDEGGKLLAAVKTVKGLDGNVKSAIKAYATDRAKGNAGSVAAVAAAIQAIGDPVKQRQQLRKIGRMRGGQVLKNQLEAFLELEGITATSSADDIRASLGRAGVSDDDIEGMDAKITDVVEGRMDADDFQGRVATYVGLDEAAASAGRGGTRARSLHVETAMMTRMESVTEGMAEVLRQQGEFNTLTQDAIDRYKGKLTPLSRTPAEDEDDS